MNKHSKYELTSSEVREVMARPPHFLITWGNTFILLVVVSCLVLLNTITLPKYLWLSYKVIKNDPGSIVLATDKKLKSGELNLKTIQLPFAGNIDKYVHFNISSVQRSGNDQTVIIAVPVENSVASQGSSRIKDFGEAKVMVAQLTLIERIIQQFQRH